MIAKLPRRFSLFHVKVEMKQSYLGVGQQPLYVFGHTGGVVGCRTADALDHVHAIARLLADCAVVLWAPEVCAFLGHLRQLQPLRTPECTSNPSTNPSINQSFMFAVRDGEPGMTHSTHWPESTGECTYWPESTGECTDQRSMV